MATTLLLSIFAAQCVDAQRLVLYQHNDLAIVIAMYQRFQARGLLLNSR